MTENVEELKTDDKQNLTDSESVNSVANDNVEELNTAKNDTESEKADESKADEKSEEESFKDKFYYVAAEMENMRKRHERERENLVKYGNEKLLSSLLEVVDNLDRSMEAAAKEEDEKIKNICIGIEMVQKQFSNILKDNGLESVKTNGELFDPNFHEAMAQQPAEDKKHHEIITEFQKGYILNGRLLRPAKVIIVNNEN